jgi:hypothetical protein
MKTTSSFIYMIILTPFVMLTFIALIGKIIQTIKMDSTFRKEHHNQAMNHTMMLAILFILLFLGWLIAAGLTIGQHLISGVLGR